MNGWEGWDQNELCENCGEWIEEDDVVCRHCNSHEDCCDCDEVDSEDSRWVVGDCLICEQSECQCSVRGGSFLDEKFSRHAIREIEEAGGGYRKYRRN